MLLTWYWPWLLECSLGRCFRQRPVWPMQLIFTGDGWWNLHTKLRRWNRHTRKVLSTGLFYLQCDRTIRFADEWPNSTQNANAPIVWCHQRHRFVLVPTHTNQLTGVIHLLTFIPANAAALRSTILGCLCDSLLALKVPYGQILMFTSTRTKR